MLWDERISLTFKIIYIILIYEHKIYELFLFKVFINYTRILFDAIKIKRTIENKIISVRF